MMRTDSVQQSVIDQEKYQKNKIQRSLNHVFESEDLSEKVKGRVLRIADEEGYSFMLSREQIDHVWETIWTFLDEDFEYIPGYIDEYVNEIHAQFYSGEKISLEQIAQYVFDCSLKR